MKNLLQISLVFIFGILLTSCSSDASNQGQTNTTDSTSVALHTENEDADSAVSEASAEVKVIYFHATRRCATCNAIEKVCTDFLKENYGEKVRFTSVNHEDDMHPLVTRYNVSSQALYVVSGSHKTDLTGTAFMNAKSRPEKLEEELKTSIDKLL